MKPLAEQTGSSLILPCDVEDVASVDAVFETIGKQWGTMDFLVHAIAFSDKNELKGRYADSTRENFIRTMVISCYAFTEAARRAASLMPNGGAMVTLTYNGGLRAMPNYNVMGVAKAALEAGEDVPGYSLSAGRAERHWRDETVAYNALLSFGLTRDDVIAEAMRSPKQVELRAKARGLKVPTELIVSHRSGVSMVRSENVRVPVPGRVELARTLTEALEAFQGGRQP